MNVVITVIKILLITTTFLKEYHYIYFSLANNFVLKINCKNWALHIVNNLVYQIPTCPSANNNVYKFSYENNTNFSNKTYLNSSLYCTNQLIILQVTLSDFIHVQLNRTTSLVCLQHTKVFTDEDSARRQSCTGSTVETCCLHLLGTRISGLLVA
jgi:hypothetical protein